MPSRALTRRERQFVATSGYAATLASISTQRGRDQVGRFVRGAHSVARNIGRIFVIDATKLPIVVLSPTWETLL